jgi:hypothetical protein
MTYIEDLLTSKLFLILGTTSATLYLNIFGAREQKNMLGTPVLSDYLLHFFCLSTLFNFLSFGVQP